MPRKRLNECSCTDAYWGLTHGSQTAWIPLLRGWEWRRLALVEVGDAGRGGEGAAENRGKHTWLWQPSQKSFQGHLVAAGGSFSLESRGKYDRGGGDLGV